MFTGIVEEIGEIRKIVSKGNTLELTVLARFILSDIKLGDSIALNGVCLTVVYFDSCSFTVDVMPVTFKDTTLHLLAIGSKVNCERALALGSRVGGHFVSGHVDDIGIIVSRHKRENAVVYKLSLAEKFMNLCIEKGSIAIDGTSLTIFEINRGDHYVEVSLVPHTQKMSILAHKKIGDKVNIEIDLLAKQLENRFTKRDDITTIDKIMNVSKKKVGGNITYEFLRNNGYV